MEPSNMGDNASIRHSMLPRKIASYRTKLHVEQLAKGAV